MHLLSACLPVRRLRVSRGDHGYRATVDPSALGAGLLIFLHISIEGLEGDAALAELAASAPEVIECHMIAGEEDYLPGLRMATMAAFNEFYERNITTLPGLTHSRTRVVLRTVTAGD